MGWFAKDMRWFMKEIIPLLIMLAIILVLTLVPYYSTKRSLEAEEQTQAFLCKFSGIMREFANTAADARFGSAAKGSPALKEINLHAARVYVHVRNELKNLPPDGKCNLAIKGSK